MPGLPYRHRIAEGRGRITHAWYRALHASTVVAQQASVVAGEAIPYDGFDELILLGDRASQPAAASVTPGTLYSVTDEGHTIERSDGTAWALYSPTGGNTTATFSFDYSSATVAPPTSSQIRFNALHPYTAVTTLWTRTVTTDGVDVQTFLLLVPTGSTVYVQDRNDHSLYARFTTTAAAVDHTTYVELPVAWVANGGALLNNQAVEVLVVTGGGGGGGAPDPHHTTHESGGSDAITALDASVLTTGTVAGARLPPYYDYLEGTPANPAADTIRLYAVDYNGFTFLEERDSAGRTIRTSRDTVAVGKVDEAGGIVRGQCVYVSGASGANRLLKKALATSRTTTPAFGLAMESGAVNTFIRVLTSGLLTGVDTSAIAEGARVFLSETTPGALTVTAPLAPNLVQRVGWVLRQHATVGEIGVLPATALSEASWVTTHASMHEPGGRDPLTALAQSQVTGLVAALASKVDTTGTPVAAQLALFHDADTIKGDPRLTSAVTSVLQTSGAFDARGLTMNQLPLTTRATQPILLLQAYSPAISFVDKDTVRAFHIGINDDDTDALHIGNSFIPGSTPIVRIEAVNNHVTLPFGRLEFPATANPSTNATVFDDYREGNWSATIAGSGGASGGTIYAEGAYVKWGRMVWAGFHISLTVKGTVSGDFRLGNLPFTAETGVLQFYAGSVTWNVLVTSWVTLQPRVLQGTNLIYFVGTNAASTSANTVLQGTDVQNGSGLTGMVVYRAAL